MLVFSAALPGAEPAADPDAEAIFRQKLSRDPALPRLVIKTEFIEVDAKAYASWTADPQNSNEGPALRAHVETLLKSGQARLRDLNLTATTSGERLKNESITFLIHPSEFSPPKAGANGSATTPAIALATECRNLGFTVECDSILSRDGKTIELNLAPEIVTESGESRHGAAEAEVTYPRFHYLKTTTQVAAPEGKPVLLAVLSDDPPESAALPVPVLVFVQADVHRHGDRKP